MEGCCLLSGELVGSCGLTRFVEALPNLLDEVWRSYYGNTPEPTSPKGTVLDGDGADDVAAEREFPQNVG